MPRYSRRRQPKTKKYQADRSILANAKQFVCQALHNIPDVELIMSTVSDHKSGAYMNSWAKRGLSHVGSGSACVAYLTPRTITLLPLPVAIDATVAPYAIGYDFCYKDSDYYPVARYYGFIIATMPCHDWQRAESWHSLDQPDLALLHADRALLGLYRLKADNLSSAAELQIEKTYTLHCKLRNLYIAEPGKPEGTLAYARAMEQAHKCYASLLDG